MHINIIVIVQIKISNSISTCKTWHTIINCLSSQINKKQVCSGYAKSISSCQSNKNTTFSRSVWQDTAWYDMIGIYMYHVNVNVRNREFVKFLLNLIVNVIVLKCTHFKTHNLRVVCVCLVICPHPAPQPRRTRCFRIHR